MSESEQTPLPCLRDYTVSSHDSIPSRGFITPHSRARHEIIENITDRRTAMQLYALVHEGGYGNYEAALKAAIQKLHKQIDAQTIRWRYYCRGCEFIGGSYRTHAAAEQGAYTHAEVCDSAEVVPFAYRRDDYGPDSVEQLVEAYGQKCSPEVIESAD